jgi:hypothetical protein
MPPVKLRDVVQQIIAEFMGPMPPAAQALLNVGPNKAKPPPLPGQARAASASLPKKGALTKFKASLSMAAEAGARAKEESEQANTKEALRWLDKMIDYATAAKQQLIP